MKSRRLTAVPLILGIASMICFVLYYYGANGGPDLCIAALFVGPVLSFIGVIFSILTRKSRKTYPILWTAGILFCFAGFLVCAFVWFILVMLGFAMLNGTWI